MVQSNRGYYLTGGGIIPMNVDTLGSVCIYVKVTILEIIGVYIHFVVSRL